MATIPLETQRENFFQGVQQIKQQCKDAIAQFERLNPGVPYKVDIKPYRKEHPTSATEGTVEIGVEIFIIPDKIKNGDESTAKEDAVSV